MEKWLKNNRFEGIGYEEYEEKGAYKISGEIDSSRVLVATYKNADYPTKGYVGVFILELSVDGESMEGYWYGRTRHERVKGGKVTCKRI